MTLIRDVRVFDGEQATDGLSVRFADGVITEVGAGLIPDGDEQVIDGTGQTLLPGLIDAHTHVFGMLDNLEVALNFGVTTELDMFSFPPDYTRTLCATSKERDDLADMFTAGVLVSEPEGHPAVRLPGVPTLAGPEQAAEFVAQRRAEGSDFIKVMIEDGEHLGEQLPYLDQASITATTTAAREQGLLTVAHICGVWSAELALHGGVDVLTHLPLEAPLPEELVALAVREKRACIPTLVMMEMSSPGDTGRSLAADERLAPHLNEQQRRAITEGTEGLPVEEQAAGHDFANAVASARRLHEAGVPMLAGTDANSASWRDCPVVHGVSMHRELELLVLAGLSPAEALAAGTSAPAVHFGLNDRGRIRPGLRADLLLVHGDPTTDITATRAISRVWCRGTEFDRTNHLETADES